MDTGLLPVLSCLVFFRIASATQIRPPPTAPFPRQRGGGSMRHGTSRRASRSQGVKPLRGGTRWLLQSLLLVAAALCAESANRGSEEACVNACAPDGTCTCIAPPRAAASKLAIESCLDAGGQDSSRDEVSGFPGQFATALLQGRRVRQEDVVQVAAVRRHGSQGGGGAGEVVDEEEKVRRGKQRLVEDPGPASCRQLCSS